MRKVFAAVDPVAKELSWVPEAVLNYLAHTEGGASIRALARRAGCHASTVSRQVRAFEARRDDMLVDEALRRLGHRVISKANIGSSNQEPPMSALPKHPETETPTLTETRLNSEARRILRRLCETGAVLAVASEMDKAVVVREFDGHSNRTAIVDREVAEAMALKTWITCETPGRISRYRISPAGRIALGQLVADAENEAQGFVETDAEFLGQDESQLHEEPTGRRRLRYGLADTPLILLARRRDRDGSRFLGDDLVRAGERLREDFEMAELPKREDLDWETYLKTEAVPSATNPNANSATLARQRVLGALRDLGPGLADVALRCCCFLEGLETTEKNMGWSARSGKIVLRIALQRLKRHYNDLGDDAGLMG